MKNLIKRLSVLAMAVVMVAVCAACGGETANAKFYTGNVKKEDSGAVAENGNFTLEWDNDKAALLLRSKKTGRVWCTTPYSFYQNDTGEGLASVALSSPLNITYVETETLSVKTVSGTTGVLKNGRVASKKIKNGIRVTYFFDKLEITVPVDYILNDRGLEVRLLVSGIYENEYPIYKVSLHPYMVNTPNNDSSYLVVPSGSGGIIRTNNGVIKDYTEYIYGEDPVKVSWADTSFIEKSALPIFGAACGEDSILGIIEKGADAAMVETHACDSEIGYSGAYVSFMLRGYDMTTFTDKAGQAKPVKKYSDSHLNAEYLSVCYYPMEGYSPDYAGMASLYRDVLKDSGKLPKASENAPALALDILGGAESNKLILGLPYRSLDVATTVSEAHDIVEELNGELDAPLLVRLSGFTESGLDAGKVGGGFKLSNKFGSLKKLKSFNSYCESYGNILAFDFDLMRYSSSGGGFSTTADSVQTANLITRTFEFYNVATNDSDKRGPQYYLLSPSRFKDAGKKLTATVDKMELSAVSLSSFGSLTYSDYSYTKYHCKGGNADAVVSVLKSLQKQKTEVITKDANIYAALLSDYVTHAPVGSSKYDCIDMDIPLYQMILRGTTNLYSSYINVANDPRLEFLKAIECGSGLCFSICADVPSGLKHTVHSAFAASRYASVKDELLSYMDEASNFLASVGSSSISMHNSNGSLAHTVFSNGVEVYVNYSDTALDTPIGTVGARSFVYGKEAA